jgi:hypothetical protein
MVLHALLCARLRGLDSRRARRTHRPLIYNDVAVWPHMGLRSVFVDTCILWLL